MNFSNKKIKILVIAILIPLLLIVIIHTLLLSNKIVIDYPLNESLFPIDFAAPTIVWSDKDSKASKWEICYYAGKEKYKFKFTSNKPKFRIDSLNWREIIISSKFKPIEIEVTRSNDENKPFCKPNAKITIRISPDEVGSPILYREIPLPFVYAETFISKASYNLYNVSVTNNPRMVLDEFPVCSNCHSSSLDVTTLALDFDAVTRDKGGFFIADLDTNIIFNKDNYISWSKIQGTSTFGLFSKISPSGRYVVTTIKDRAISKKFMSMDSMEYSQLFFPVNGVLAIYDRETKELKELPGANDTAFVQSNAFWTPDEKYLIYARSKSLPLPPKGAAYRSFLSNEPVVKEYLTGKRTIQYDLYKVPFNGGNGGNAEPIMGASGDGMSNYFPAVSPDGKWLIFCKSKNFMMLQPDSKLYLVPIEGGKAKQLECNFTNMNSWHAWSPNSKWVVFASKGFSIFTDMFLTHIDEKGNASVPVLLENTKRQGNAINYPEFLAIDPATPLKMHYQYINTEFINDAIDKRNPEKAKELLKAYLEQGNLYIPDEFRDVGEIYTRLQQPQEAEKYFAKAIEMDSIFFRAK